MRDALQERKNCGNYRTLTCKQGLIDFASNDYLGLARSAVLKRAVLEKWERLEDFSGLGSTGSRLLSGNHPFCEELEERIARFHGFEAALLFSSGFLANFGLLSCLAREGDAVIYDTHVHASTHEGIKACKASKLPFRHNDLDHLETRLRTAQGKEVYVCVEGIYSTDGSVSSLQEIASLCTQYGAHLIVDEAHSVGVFGKGLCQQKEVFPFIQVVTFGKALGVQGAAILGSHLVKRYLINFCKSFIYSTALPLVSLIAISSSYDLFPHLENERKHLYALIQLFQKALSPIQFIAIQQRDRLKRKVTRLQEEGFDVRALLSPTVPQTKEGIRICLHAFNTLEEVSKLCESLSQE